MLRHPGGRGRPRTTRGAAVGTEELLTLGLIALSYGAALLVLGFWFLGQLWSAASAPPGEPGVAFAAHIGGFVAGLALVSFFKHRRVPLLEPPHHKPFQIERRRGPWG